MRYVLYVLPWVLLACSKEDPVSPAEPAGKRVSSSITRSEPVAGLAEAVAQELAVDTMMVPFVVTGIITNNTDIGLPPGIRVVLLWSVGGDPDRNYLWGETEPNLADMTFELPLPTPPDDVLNRGTLGVAYIVVLDSSASLEEGFVPLDFDYGSGFIGGATRHNVIYYEGGHTGEDTHWVHDFPTGYSVGRGIEIPDEYHEGFEPVEPTGIEITVDDLEDLVFVNWS